MVVSIGGLSQPILWNDENRNPREMQPGASDSNLTPIAGEGSRTSWRLTFEKWSAYIGDKRAPGSCKEYRQKVTATFEWIERTTGKTDLRAIEWEDLNSYLRHWNESWQKRRHRRLQPNTENVWVAAVQSFYDHAIVRLELDRYGVRNVGRKLERHSIETVNRSKENLAPISRDQFQKILALAESEDEIRWSLAAKFQWTTISRNEDVWLLRWAMLDLSRTPKATYPRPSKHGYNAVKLLDAGLGRRLREWRSFKDPAPDAPVFRDALSSQKAFQTWFNRRFKEYAARTDVPVRVSSHTIRKSANTHAIACGAPELFLKRQGAWSIASAWDAYCLQDMETYREKELDKLALD
jgi:site-specific recombinase XerD